MHSPWNSPAFFWRPRHVVASPLLEEIPFLFWIFESTRPTTVAQIGLGDGLIYMALCQAAECSGRLTSVMGFATDTLASEESALLGDFQQQHDALYFDFSTLMPLKQPFDGVKLMASVDMLVLNAAQIENQQRALMEEWLPRMSDRAVILVCQPDRVFGHADLRTGPSALSGPAIKWPHSPGRGNLDVILHGSKQPEHLARLASNEFDTQEWMVFRQVLGRLGRSVIDADQLERLKCSHEDVQLQLEDSQTQAKQRINELEQCLEVSRLEAEQLRRNLEEERRQNAQLEAACSGELARVEALRANMVTIEATLEQNRSYVTQLSADKAATERQLSKTIQMFHNSTSWRVTKPLRAVKLMFRSRKPRKTASSG